MTGLISTVAGVGYPGYNGDDIPATHAQLYFPVGITLDANGGIYIADAFNNDIRKVTPSPIVVNPSSVNFGSINVGQTSAAQSLTFTFNIATQIGNIGVLTNGISGKDFRSAAGTTCKATTYNVGFSCILNLLFSPTLPGIRSGAVILYDTSSPANEIGLVPLSGTGVGPIIAFEPGLITAMAGTGGVGGFSGDNGPAFSAELSTPVAVAEDGAGNLYVADYDNNRVRRVDATTGVITTFAGGGTGCTQQSDTLGDGCTATDAVLSPFGLAVDSSGNVYITDYPNNRIRRVDAATGIITTFAGGGTGCSLQTDMVGDGCSATSATLIAPVGIKLDSSDNLYIADSGTGRVRKVDGKSGIITNLAGNGIQGFNGDGGLATNAELSLIDVAVDTVGNVYISDRGNYRIRKVDAATGIITTFAGTGVIGYSGDNGLATQAEIAGPWGLSIDAAGDLYIADLDNSNVRKVDGATNIIRTIVGGVGICISVDAAGKLYVANGNNNLVQAVSTATPPISFPDTNTGSTSAAQTITVANIGNSPLTFNNLTASQNFGIDGGATTCSTSSPVASGDSCRLGIVFAPTTSGPRKTIRFSKVWIGAPQPHNLMFDRVDLLNDSDV